MCINSKVLAIALLGVTGPASAGVLLPPTFDVVNDPYGTTVQVGDVSADDMLSLVVSGTAYLQSPSMYGVNAAGVRTVAGDVWSVGGAWLDAAAGFSYGALVVTLNGVQSRQLFASDAANGVNAAVIPDDLSFNGRIGDLFEIGTPLTGATLNFTVHDTGYGDNSGSFRVTALNAVPEPATWTMLLLGFSGLGHVMRRRPTVSNRSGFYSGAAD